MNGLTKIVAILTVLCMAGMCFAPIEQKPPGSKFHSELSEAEMSRLQGSVAGQGLGSAPSPKSEDIRIGSGDEQAAGILSGSASTASKVLVEAGKESKSPPKKGGPNMWLAGLIVILGVGAAYGYKTYFGKSDE